MVSFMGKLTRSAWAGGFIKSRRSRTKPPARVLDEGSSRDGTGPRHVRRHESKCDDFPSSAECDILRLSVPDGEGPNNTALDQAGKIMLAGIVPTQMPAATGALTKRPGMTWKPSVLEGRQARLPAFQSLGKSDDCESNPLGVRERKLVL